MVKIQKLILIGFDPLCFFQKLGRDERSPAFFTSGRWCILAWNPSRTISSKSIGALQDVKKALSKRRSSLRTDLPFIGGAIGYVSYDAGLAQHKIRSRHRPSFKNSPVCFHIYDNTLLFDGQKVVVVGDKRFVQNVREIHHRPLVPSSNDPIHWSPSVSRAQYARAFSAIKHGITEGDYYQLNFTYPMTAESSRNPRSLFAACARHNPAPVAAYLEHDTSAILSLSPERFVTIESGVITTSPIKGTRTRSSDPKKDKQLASDLLRSEKEQAELNMIVDLLRNDIGKVSLAGSVKVTGHRLLQQNPSVWHTYSTIEGRLDSAIHPLDAFTSMFPGGSVTGCPKVAAMEEIDRLESSSRGSYCGSMVMISDSGFLDSSILIRTVVKDRTKLSLGVGGGIVADSMLDQEFEETKKKAERFMTLPSRQVWINGKVAKHRDPRLKALDPSNKKSNGVFETMRVQDGKIQNFSAHMKRLQRSPSPLPPLPRGEGNFRLKIVRTSRDVITELSPLVVDPAIYEGVSVTVAKLERQKPEIKALPYHREWAAYQEALIQRFHESLLINRRGKITEGAISNLFFVRRGVLHTPHEDVLPGITRAHVLRLAKRLKIRVSFATPTLKELLSADEIFLTRSTVGIVPVVVIDQHIISKGMRGTITRKLMEYLVDSPRP